MQLEHAPVSDDVARLVHMMEAYARAAQTLRFSPLAQDSFLRDLPLSLAQLKALGMIACAGPVGRSGRELAALLGVGPSAITPLVDRLVEHGFVTRHEDAVDRRVLRVRATPDGVETLERVASVRRDVLAEIAKRIDPSDLPIVERSLVILTDAVERLATEQRVHV
jgi:DNA-binding MarR family transcriptional regulator